MQQKSNAAWTVCYVSCVIKRERQYFTLSQYDLDFDKMQLLVRGFLF